jgi:3-dehydroquinate synthase
MQTFTVKGATGGSRIVLGERVNRLAHYIANRHCVIVSDEHVYPLYRDHLPANLPSIVIGTGEGIKTLDTVTAIYHKLLDAEVDRSSLIVAVGGGIVCDIAGFAAATYLRGLACGFVPTTLLAQVDASVGGKNGVNFQGYKNLIGVFAQPEFVLLDVNVLPTLPKPHLGCGFAEAIKHGAIADPELFAFMESHAAQLKQLEPDSIERIVNDSIVIKSTIVNRDEKEQGERRKLNFGHTFGHAIEKTLCRPHGEAVAIGMVAATKLSSRVGALTDADVQRLTNVLAAFDLPTTIAADSSRLKEAIRRDKKRYGDSIRFVLLNRLGEAFVRAVPLPELEGVIDDLCTTR